jgi:hypothetical protein
MTIEQSAFPAFNEQNQTVIRTDEDYTMSNQDKVVDVFGGTGLTVRLPPQPVFGQSHRVMATVAAVTVNGNGHPIRGLFALVPANATVDYTFSSVAGGSWVASCCAEGIG